MSDRGQDLRLLEALLFAAAQPLDEATLATRLPEGTDIAGLLPELAETYRNRGGTPRSPTWPARPRGSSRKTMRTTMPTRTPRRWQRISNPIHRRRRNAFLQGQAGLSPGLRLARIAIPGGHRPALRGSRLSAIIRPPPADRRPPLPSICRSGGSALEPRSASERAKAPSW